MVCSLITLYLGNFFYKFVMFSNAWNGMKITGWLLFIILNDEDTKLYSAVSFHDFHYYTQSISIYYYIAIPILKGGSEAQRDWGLNYVVSTNFNYLT